MNKFPKIDHSQINTRSYNSPNPFKFYISNNRKEYYFISYMNVEGEIRAIPYCTSAARCPNGCRKALKSATGAALVYEVSKKRHDMCVRKLQKLNLHRYIP